MEFDDIQGIVLSSYRTKTHSSYVFLRIADRAGARTWLRGLASRTSTAAGRREEIARNVAFTSSGLAALGVDHATLGTFPLEYREGLSGSETRSRTLGDTGESAPAAWAWGGPASPVDVLLMLYASSGASLAELRRAELAAACDSGAATVVVEIPTTSLPDRKEHFGFADGISQPEVQGARRGRGASPAIAAGEFILGYENAYGQMTALPTAKASLDVRGCLGGVGATGDRALGRNGTYLVVRQLQQHVFRFWDFMRRASNGRDSAIALASKCVGRWPSGAPLVATPDRDDAALANDNRFGYFWRDRHGLRCPIGAHIRRSNPRDSLAPDPITSSTVVERHRILRRGRSYGPYVPDPWLADRDDGVDRGLVFMCVNANIRRQFEFIQQTWLDNPKFGGLYDERDPLIGSHDEDANAFTVPHDPVRRRVTGLSRFVTVRGGAYFFLPGVRALGFLGNLPDP